MTKKPKKLTRIKVTSIRFWAYQLKQNQKIKAKFNNHFSEVVFPNFEPLDAGFGYFWPQIRILPEISSLEQVGKVQNLESRSKKEENLFKDIC